MPKVPISLGHHGTSEISFCSPQIQCRRESDWLMTEKMKGGEIETREIETIVAKFGPNCNRQGIHLLFFSLSLFLLRVRLGLLG